MCAAKQQAARTAGLTVQGTTVIGRGDWTVRHLERLEADFRQIPWPDGTITIDLSAVGRMDTGGAWLLQRLLAALESEQRHVEVQGLSPKAAGLLGLVRSTSLQAGAVPYTKQPGIVEDLGRKGIDSIGAGIGLVAFVGEMGSAWFRQVLHPGRIRWGAVSESLVEAGHRALGIVGLLSFLLGIVIAYQGGIQLRQYGASLFVADLVGLSMVRELAPLITAIIVAGRTGSAYTAQIGTMQVTEEVDALRSMGIPPMDLLVLPKLFALIVALPLLTVFADIMGVLGGMVMSGMQLDIAFATYIQRLGVAISVDSFLVGVGKAPVFAAIIATIGCYQGFQVAGSAESVGRRTTTSVVHSILAVIVVDAAFSVAFSRLGI